MFTVFVQINYYFLAAITFFSVNKHNVPKKNIVAAESVKALTVMA